MDKTGVCLVVVLGLAIIWDIANKWINYNKEKLQLKRRTDLYNWKDEI